MNNNLKPDLGLALSERYGQEITHHFYSVKIVDIIHVGENLYSTMTETTVETVDYALSFDFDLQQLKNLIMQISNSEFKKYLESVLIKSFIQPDKAVFYETPIELDVKGKLGELVQSKYESFIPIVVDEFLNVRITD